jgi:hypothetical protein
LAAATAALKDLAPLAKAALTALFQAEGLRETARAIITILYMEFYHQTYVSTEIDHFFTVKEAKML